MIDITVCVKNNLLAISPIWSQTFGRKFIRENTNLPRALDMSHEKKIFLRISRAQTRRI
jgi:hypothetical protein